MPTAVGWVMIEELGVACAMSVFPDPADAVTLIEISRMLDE